MLPRAGQPTHEIHVHAGPGKWGGGGDLDNAAIKRARQPLREKLGSAFGGDRSGESHACVCEGAVATVCAAVPQARGES